MDKIGCLCYAYHEEMKSHKLSINKRIRLVLICVVSEKVSVETLEYILIASLLL